MTDPRLFRLRATFVEEGRLAMLSHLEVAHTLERVVRRAKLPFAISQGYSPHMKIAFGSALPVGAITSRLGAPFFLAIIFTRKGEHN